MTEESRIESVVHIIRQSGISKYLVLIDRELITIPRILADIDSIKHKQMALISSLEVIRDCAQAAIIVLLNELNEK